MYSSNIIMLCIIYCIVKVIIYIDHLPFKNMFFYHVLSLFMFF